MIHATPPPTGMPEVGELQLRNLKLARVVLPIVQPEHMVQVRIKALV